MPNWFTSPLIKADDIDQPSTTRTPGQARVAGFLGGALEATSSPLDAALTFLPYGRLAKGAKALYGAATGSKGVSAAVSGLQQASKGNRWAAGQAPKPDGALHGVLSRAGEKSAVGDTLTPGERGLLAQFSGYLKGPR